MNPPALATLPNSQLLTLGWIGLVVILGFWLQSGDWRKLLDAKRSNLFLGATVAVMALWQVRTGIRPGLDFHLFGITALTLMFGFSRAVLAGVLVQAASAAFGHGAWNAIGLNTLALVAVPAGFTALVHGIVQRHLPRHLFVYLMLSGFISAGIGVMLAGAAESLALFLGGAYGLSFLLENYLAYYILVAFSEAFLSGGVVTLMAVYRPSWLESYDEAAYIPHV